MNNMIEQFQCPGCINGSNTQCEKFRFNSSTNGCSEHVIGTSLNFFYLFALGLPKGFCRFSDNTVTNKICLYESLEQALEENYNYDFKNIPVWKYEEDGYLFLRVYCPRIDWTSVHIIKNGKLSDFPNVIDMTENMELID